MKIDIKKTIQLFTKSINDFLDEDGMKLSASLSYYTVFSFPPLAILVVSIAARFFGEHTAREEFYEQMTYLFGEETALQLADSVLKMSINNNNVLATIIGVGMLFFTASAMFGEIQSSLNSIWKLKANTKKAWLTIIRKRLLSFAMILLLGTIMVATLILTTLLQFLQEEIIALFEEDVLYLTSLIDKLVVFVVIVTLFAFLFKTLPDGRLHWKETLVGACFTALLFMAGKWGINFYIANSPKDGLYGTAGSVLVLLIWVYYSAIIFYFGAIFTKNYSELFGKPIGPNSYAVRVKYNEEIIEMGSKKND